MNPDSHEGEPTGPAPFDSPNREGAAANDSGGALLSALENAVTDASSSIPHFGPHLDELPAASSRATSAFVLGLLGLLGPIMLITFPAAIPAWILGHSERKAIRAGQAPALGYGLATAGWVMGIIGSIFFGLLLLLFAAIIALVIMAGALGGMSGFDTLGG